MGMSGTIPKPQNPGIEDVIYIELDGYMYDYTTKFRGIFDFDLIFMLFVDFQFFQHIEPTNHT